MNRRVVMKFGGSSVATVEKLQRVAQIILDRRAAGWDVVAVVSAMGDDTDHLLEKARAISREPHRRELDMLLSVGERISMSLLALAIRERGQAAVSLTGSQSGIITTASHAQARIVEVRPFRVEDELEGGRVVIVAGYQGVSYTREITTLGRGGSDTTAVALAAALRAQACEIYSDVEGVFTSDPRVVDSARLIEALGFEEMQELAEAGAKVLNAQAVEFAKARGIAIYARKTGGDSPGTVVRANAPAPESGVRGLAHQRQVLLATAAEVSDASADAVLAALETLDVAPRGFGHRAGGALEVAFGLDDVHARDSLEASLAAALPGLKIREDVGAVAVIGPGIGRRPDLLRRALQVSRRFGEVASVSTSSFRISLIVPRASVEDVIRALHGEMGLDGTARVASLP